jgi:hypothetical protein
MMITADHLGAHKSAGHHGFSVDEERLVTDFGHRTGVASIATEGRRDRRIIGMNRSRMRNATRLFHSGVAEPAGSHQWIGIAARRPRAAPGHPFATA